MHVHILLKDNEFWLNGEAGTGFNAWILLSSRGGLRHSFELFPYAENAPHYEAAYFGEARRGVSAGLLGSRPLSPSFIADGLPPAWLHGVMRNASCSSGGAEPGGGEWIGPGVFGEAYRMAPPRATTVPLRVGDALILRQVVRQCLA